MQACDASAARQSGSIDARHAQQGSEPVQSTRAPFAGGSRRCSQARHIVGASAPKIQALRGFVNRIINLSRHSPAVGAEPAMDHQLAGDLSGA
jgi:hypothetical protein